MKKKKLTKKVQLHFIFPVEKENRNVLKFRFNILSCDGCIYSKDLLIYNKYHSSYYPNILLSYYPNNIILLTYYLIILTYNKYH